MFKINEISFNKLFLTIISIFLLLFFITMHMFYKVDKKSDQMIYHKSTLVKGVSSIKYNLASVHLWFMEYVSGEEKNQEKIDYFFAEAKKILKELNDLESSDDDIHHSKHRDEKLILNSIKDIKKSVESFEKLTTFFLNNEVVARSFNDVNYDTDYEILIDKLEVFDELIIETHILLSKELNSHKQKIYMFISLLIILTIIFTFYILKNEDEKVSQIRRKDEFIAGQYKLAAMGEMIDAIAHQWKTPLGIIRMHADYTHMSIELNEAKLPEIEKDMEKVMYQVDHLIDTINEFRSFFRPDTKSEILALRDIIDSTMILMKDELKRYQISTKIDCDEDILIKVNQNEIKHVLINLVQNSRDAFIENKTPKRSITFTTMKSEDEIILKICDNAGGIPEHVIDKIFIPHFTTKSEDKGTGIGLYLTKQIVEKYNGFIDVQNQNNGACFYISFRNSNGGV